MLQVLHLIKTYKDNSSVTKRIDATSYYLPLMPPCLKVVNAVILLDKNEKARITNICFKIK